MIDQHIDRVLAVGKIVNRHDTWGHPSHFTFPGVIEVIVIDDHRIPRASWGTRCRVRIG
jgi:hypothetical protein